MTLSSFDNASRIPKKLLFKKKSAIKKRIVLDWNKTMAEHRCPPRFHKKASAAISFDKKSVKLLFPAPIVPAINNTFIHPLLNIVTDKCSVRHLFKIIRCSCRQISQIRLHRLRQHQIDRRGFS